MYCWLATPTKVRLVVPTTVWKVLHVIKLFDPGHGYPDYLVLMVEWTVTLLATAMLVTLAIITRTTFLIMLASIVKEHRMLSIQLRVIRGLLRGNATPIMNTE